MAGPLRPTPPRAAALLVALTTLVAGCGATASTSRTPASPVELTVYAAASLRDVLDELAPRYEADHPGVKIVAAYDSSTTLRVQIEQGAPADLFLSADRRNATQLANEGCTAGPALVFARNRLAIVVPLGDPAHVADWRALARPGLRLVAANPDVPVQGYADALASRLAALPGAPAGFAAAVQRNVVSREDNVRTVLARIALGEGDAAIVYSSDARSTDGVATIPIPAAANLSADYLGVAIAGRHAGAAQALLAWLASPAAQAAFARRGFAPLS